MKCAVVAVVLAVLLGLETCWGQVPVPVPIPKGVLNPLDLLKMASLIGCRLNGLDGGIDREFARTMLGFGSRTTIQRCMLGCVIGWLHTSNEFMKWEFGIDMVPKVPGKILGSMQGTFRGCVGGVLRGQKKCQIVPELVKCFINSEKKKIIAKFKSTFMPWLPCWDYLKTRIPIVRTIDKTVNFVKDSFIQNIEHGIGNFIHPNNTINNPDLSSPITQQPLLIGPLEKPGTNRSNNSTTKQLTQVKKPAEEEENEEEPEEDEPDESANDQPAESANHQPTEAPNDKPAESANHQPAEAPGDKPAESANDQPAETAHQPTEAPNDKPAEAVNGQPEPPQEPAEPPELAQPVAEPTQPAT